MVARNLVWFGLLMTACGGVEGTNAAATAEPASMTVMSTLGGAIVAANPMEGSVAPATPPAAIPADLPSLLPTPPAALARERIAIVPASRAPWPGDAVDVRAYGLLPETTVVIEQGAAVEANYRFCGPAVVDAGGVALVTCRISPTARAASQAKVYEGVRGGALLATGALPVAALSDRIFAEAARYGLSLKVQLRGRAPADSSVRFVVLDPHGTMMVEDVAFADHDGYWTFPFTVADGKAALGRWDLLARSDDDTAWMPASFIVAPLVYGSVSRDVLAMAGFGFVEHDDLVVEFFSPDGLMVASEAGSASSGFSLVGAGPPLCESGGQWIVRVWYHDATGTRTWSDTPVTSGTGWCTTNIPGG